MMHVCVFAPIPYFFLHQRPQKITEQLRSMSVGVTYVEPSGISEYLSGTREDILRGLGESLYRHLQAVVHRLRHSRGSGTAAHSSSVARQDFSRVVMPMIVPHNRFDSMWLEKLNVSVYRRALMERVLRRMKDDEESVAVVQNPFWAGALDADDFSRIYYDCMDEISLYAGKSSLDRFQRYEERLVGMSKGIFVTARKSEERLRSRYPGIPIYRIPNGVDAGWFEARTKESGVPPDVSAIRKPLVGYVGALYTWLDYELISEVAAALPEISFVFVGPIGDRKRVTGICANTNIHFLGRKGYDQVPLYIDAFNACIIPFKPGPISQATNPVKLFEYFALGKPVVSTALSELEPYAEDKLVYMTGERAEFASLVRTALSEADKTLAAKRKQVARENSWRAHAERMYAVFVRDGQESGPHHV